jgi:uncharacterized protein YukE
VTSAESSTSTFTSTSSSSYTERSLDDLRMLTNSVETARIHDMQSHFAGIATQLNDVIDQLQSLRTDLPHWWTGPASEATQTSFSQVISHAQSTQDVASGASQALRLCAQVVGEQQSAMEQVPEIAAPASNGTGFVGDESLYARGTVASEVAMQHAASYENARGRAVRVVQGVAAQLVETRGQLASLMDASDEGFQPVNSAISSQHALTPIGAASSASRQSAQRLPALRSTDGSSLQSTTLPGGEPSWRVSYLTSSPPVQLRNIVTEAPRDPAGNFLTEEQLFPLNITSMSEINESLLSPTINSRRTSAYQLPQSKRLSGSAPDIARDSSRQEQVEIHPSGSRANQPHEIDSSNVNSHARLDLADDMPSNPEEDLEPSSHDMTDASTATAEPDSTSEPMMGPLGLSSHAARRGDSGQSTKRPDYLTGQHQRIPRKLMAPAGGLLTAEWANEL